MVRPERLDRTGGGGDPDGLLLTGAAYYESRSVARETSDMTYLVV